MVAAVLDGITDKDMAVRRLDEITADITDLYESGREYSFDSPIETLMFNALVKALDELSCDWSYKVIPQCEIGPYRADFAVLVTGPNGEIKIAIECDGFVYHDMTIEQATHDKQRERRLVIAGFSVIRFSATEIMENADACVGEVLRCIRTLRNSQSSRRAVS